MRYSALTQRIAGEAQRHGKFTTGRWSCALRVSIFYC